MWLQATRWTVAALVGSAMTTVGCSQVGAADEPSRPRQPIVADESLVHAFDGDIDMRVRDRIQLDHFLRDREIHVEVTDGIVRVTGVVWTPLEKQRVGDLLRSVPGVIDVANDVVVRPPA